MTERVDLDLIKARIIRDICGIEPEYIGQHGIEFMDESDKYEKCKEVIKNTVNIIDKYMEYKATNIFGEKIN